MGRKKYFLKTARIGFRTWCADDFGLAKNLWGDFEVTKLFDSKGKFSDRQIQERLDQEIKTQEEYKVQYWPIFNIITFDHIGACGLRPYEVKKNIFEIGFHLCSNQWGKGYATEAAIAVIEYAFRYHNISALFAGHNPNNEVSAHLLLKLGFKYTHDEYYEPTGLMHPSYLLAKNKEVF